MKKDGYYSSGEFARMAHVTLRTVRYYDKQDILKPSLVTESGARFYTDEDFARLQQILLLKYLGFSLDDIREMTIGDSDYHFMLNSLNIQLRLVRDRIEQMQLVEKAIQDTAQMIKEQHTIDWSQMLNLIHLTGMEKASRISIRMPPTFPPGSTSTACTPRTNRDGFPGSLSNAGSHPVFVFWSWAAGTERYGPTIFPFCRRISPSHFPIFPAVCSAMPDEPSVPRIPGLHSGPLTAEKSPARTKALIW